MPPNIQVEDDLDKKPIKIILRTALIGVLFAFCIRIEAEPPPAAFPSMVVLSQHLQKAKSDLVTPEKLFNHIAAELEAAKPDLAFAHFSPSDTNWESLRSLNDQGQKKLADALRRARLLKTVTDHVKVYEMPFLEQDGKTNWTEFELSQGPDGIWTIISW